MNKEIQNRWVANLESGEYPKTKSVLRDKKGFCCLGVLADMYIKEHGLNWRDEGFFFEVDTDGDYNDSLLPREVREWAGISYEETHIHSIGTDSLARINDRTETFDEVVERIKEL